MEEPLQLGVTSAFNPRDFPGVPPAPIIAGPSARRPGGGFGRSTRVLGPQLHRKAQKFLAKLDFIFSYMGDDPRIPFLQTGTSRCSSPLALSWQLSWPFSLIRPPRRWRVRRCPARPGPVAATGARQSPTSTCSADCRGQVPPGLKNRAALRAWPRRWGLFSQPAGPRHFTIVLGRPPPRRPAHHRLRLSANPATGNRTIFYRAGRSDRMPAWNSKTGPRSTGLCRLPSAVPRRPGPCRQIGIIHAGRKSPASLSRHFRHGKKYELQFEPDGSPDHVAKDPAILAHRGKAPRHGPNIWNRRARRFSLGERGLRIFAT